MKKRAPINGKKPRTTVFNVRLEVGDIALMRSIAQAEHRTLTNLVQVFVKESIERRQEG